MARLTHWLSGFLPGAAARRRQTEEYAAAWAADNAIARSATGPLWVVLGDSTGQGIGTSRRERSYVASVLRALREQRDPGWRTINLSRSGARVADVVRTQLPLLEALDPQLVTCAIGANDVFRTPFRRLDRNLRTLTARLPSAALFATLPQGLGGKRSARVNALIDELIAAHGLVRVDVWSHTGPPWDDKFSADHFHPNDAGYAGWTIAFLEALDLEPE